MDDFLNFNRSIDAGNQNSGNEQIKTVDNTEENNLKELEQNREYILSEVEKQIAIINPLLSRHAES